MYLLKGELFIKLKLFTMMICLMVLWGCTEKQLISEETIRIGVVGDNLEQFEYSNVVYESLEVEELLKDDELKTQYNFLMISDEHFNTVSESIYIERFDSLQMPIMFIDSTKGWQPFISPITLQMPKVYNEYNEDPFKKSFVSTYEQPGIFTGNTVSYLIDEQLSREDFEELVTYIYR